jgi:hypothetical protein
MGTISSDGNDAGKEVKSQSEGDSDDNPNDLDKRNMIRVHYADLVTNGTE